MSLGCPRSLHMSLRATLQDPLAKPVSPRVRHSLVPNSICALVLSVLKAFNPKSLMEFSAIQQGKNIL